MEELQTLAMTSSSEFRQNQNQNPNVTSNEERTKSNALFIGLTSFLLIIMLVYPWILGICLISFSIGYYCLDHLNKVVQNLLIKYYYTGPYSNSNPYLLSYYKEQEEKLKQEKLLEKLSPKNQPKENQNQQPTLFLDPLLHPSLEEYDNNKLNETPSPQQNKHQQHFSSVSSYSSGEWTKLNNTTISSNKSDNIFLDTSLSPNKICSLSKSSSTHSVDKDLNTTTNTNTNTNTSVSPSPSQSGSACGVCDTNDCPREGSGENYYHHGSTSSASSSKHQYNQNQYSDNLNRYGKGGHDLRIDKRLDQSIAKFCKSVFDFYVSSAWAPWETRKQLKLAFKKLLTNFAERLQYTLFDSDGEKAVMFCEEKILPLVLHYLSELKDNKKNNIINEQQQQQHEQDEREKEEEGGTGSKNSFGKSYIEKISRLKTQRLCRQLLLNFLPQEDQKCKLWLELCVAVLGDGVLWNLILLGRNKLPNVLLYYVEEYVESIERSTVNGTSQFPAPEIFNLCSTAASKTIKKILYTVNNNNKNNNSSTSSSSANNIIIAANNENNSSSSGGEGKKDDNFSDPLSDTSNLNTNTTISHDNNIQRKNPNKIKKSSKREKLNDSDNNITLSDSDALSLNTTTTSSNSLSTTLSGSAVEEKVPLLLDSFLDPKLDLEQADRDSIASRWRPQLEEILGERDLLYCLIQYLRGQRALEYLQAVLDESPDGNVFCKKVLKLEYLPGFCRSKYFMESLGISQVDHATEAGNIMDSPGSRRKMGHTRSSSYSGINSGIQIWKLGDPKAVDGLPLHNSSSFGSTSGASASSYSSSGYSSEQEKRRTNSIEVVIDKFIRSAISHSHSHSQQQQFNQQQQKTQQQQQQQQLSSNSRRPSQVLPSQYQHLQLPMPLSQSQSHQSLSSLPLSLPLPIPLSLPILSQAEEAFEVDVEPPQQTTQKKFQISSIPLTRRVGINSKTYEDLIIPQVLSQVSVPSCDIYNCSTEVAISWMNRNHHWLQNIVNGWIQLLRPYLKSPLDNLVKSKLNQYLTVDTFIYFIDLITTAFQNNNASSSSSAEATDNNDYDSNCSPTNSRKESNISTNEIPNNTNSNTNMSEDPAHQNSQNEEEEARLQNEIKMQQLIKTLVNWLSNQIVDPKAFANSLKENEDKIILFFVDLLDILVNEVCDRSE